MPERIAGNANLASTHDPDAPVRACACGQCRAAAAAASKRARWRAATGRSAFVDAGRVRRHLERLDAAGMSRTEIESRSGVNRITILRLVRGDLVRVLPRTAAALLAVPALDDVEQLHGRVDAAWARCCLRALSARGWPPGELARQLRMSQSQLRRLLHDAATCTRSTERRARAVYAALVDVDPAPSRESTIARRRAAAAGWRPVPDAPRSRTERAARVLEDVAWLAGTDTVASIAHRVGYRTPHALERCLYRAQRVDLVDALGVA